MVIVFFFCIFENRLRQDVFRTRDVFVRRPPVWGCLQRNKQFSWKWAFLASPVGRRTVLASLKTVLSTVTRNHFQSRFRASCSKGMEFCMWLQQDTGNFSFRWNFGPVFTILSFCTYQNWLASSIRTTFLVRDSIYYVCHSQFDMVSDKLQTFCLPSRQKHSMQELVHIYSNRLLIVYG